MLVKLSRITYNLFTIASLIVYSIIIAVSFSNNSVTNPVSALPRSFASFMTRNLSSLGSSFVETQNSGSILRMHNATVMLALVGEVNASSLERPMFKPFVGINSQESYLTKNLEAYKVAKNQSEFIKPNTTVFEVKPRFSHDISLPKIPRTNLNMSNSILGAFQGLSQNCCFPPDVQVAAGKKYLVELVNLDGAIYTTAGTIVKAFGLEPFFNPSQGSNIIDEMSDPVLLFDNLSERWFASISDITEHSIRVAVSKTEDPTGIWRIYNFQFMSQPNNCSDQPFIGVSEDKVVVTVNNWGNDCNWSSGNRPPEFRGVQLTGADKIDLINGSSYAKALQSESDLSYFSLHPIINFNPTSTLLIGTAGDFGHNTIQIFHVEGTLHNLQIRVISYPIQPTHVASDGVQSVAQSIIGQMSREEPMISTGDARIQSGSSYQGKLWLAFNDGCFIIADTKSRSCIRLVEIDTITNRVLQDFDIGALASSLYYPAISIDRAGNLGIVFGYSSYTIYPSILVSTRVSSDKASSIEVPQYLKLGGAHELSNRYGDYFTASPDPSNGSIIWVAGEYHSIATWSTYVGQLYTVK
jgi:hypothetical protein